MTIKELSVRAHENAKKKGFWYGREIMVETGRGNEDLAIKLMLVITEIAEATEALRIDDQENFLEEIADAFLRLGDLVGGIGATEIISSVIENKMLVNEGRPMLHNKKF